MKKWILALLLIGSSFTVFCWAVAPLFITYAQVLPIGIDVDFTDEISVVNTIVQTQHKAIESMRDVYGNSIFGLGLLAILNLFIAIFYMFKSDKRQV